MSDEVLFHEEQQFRQAWLWLLILLIDIPVLALILVGRSSPGALLALIVPALATALLLAAKLVVDVDRDEIRVAFHLLWPTRRIAIADIRSAKATHYHALLDYGGWGVRLGWKGWAFNVDGDEGVLVQTSDGKRVLIGSRRAQDLEAAIAKALAARAA